MGFWRTTGWDQSELASRAGVDPSVISNIETGKRKPSYDTLDRIIKELGVKFSSFFALGESATAAYTEKEQHLLELRFKRKPGEEYINEAMKLSDEDLAQLIRLIRFSLILTAKESYAPKDIPPTGSSVQTDASQTNEFEEIENGEE